MNRITSCSFIAILFILLIQAGCADPTNPFFRPPDLSSVPALPDTASVEPVVFDGYKYYVMREGEGEWSLQGRADERLDMFLTFRTASGDVLQSTWADQRDWPESASMSDLSEPRGLFEGAIGMKENEHRVIVVYPSMGFRDVNQNSQFWTFRNDTLIYEIELDRIQ